jgi:aminoglycoside phosphotransferase (APT) family kinase protein
VPNGRDEEGRETFEWIEGDVPVPPYPAWSLTDEALASVGRMLRRYHDAVRSFAPASAVAWSDELADPCGGPTVCHNDASPENVVFRDGEAVALLDFDLAARGRPVWDLANTARMWIPLRPPELAGERAHLDPLHRLAVLAAGYSLDDRDHQPLVDAILLSSSSALASSNAACVPVSQPSSRRGNNAAARPETIASSPGSTRPANRSFERSQASTRSRHHKPSSAISWTYADTPHFLKIV